MIVLGIYEGHNSSACIMEDGHILAAVQEERLCRTKNKYGFPYNAIWECLSISKKTPKDINYVALSSFNIPFFLSKIEMLSSFSVEDYVSLQKRYWKPYIEEGITHNLIELFPEKEKEADFRYSDINSNVCEENFFETRIQYIAHLLQVSEEQIIVIDHHYGHAMYALWTTPTTVKCKRLIITADQEGDGLSLTMYKYENERFQLLYKTDRFKLAKIYSNITLLLGMKPNEHEYKMMGLAPYGKLFSAQKVIHFLSSLFHVEGHEFIVDVDFPDYYNYLRDHLEGVRFDDLALGTQLFIEKLFIEWINNCIKEYGIRDISFSGGFFMNTKLIYKLQNCASINNIHVHYAPGDESLSIGSCLALLSDFQIPDFNTARVPYLGREYTHCEIRNILKQTKFYYDECSIHSLAKYLYDGKPIAIFTGRCEFGPRALGHRSIFARLDVEGIVDLINNQIKNRDFWMPFAPIILEEDLLDCSSNDFSRFNTPEYMTTCFDILPDCRKKLFAGIHPKDNTARVQVVSPTTDDQFLRTLLLEYKKLNGIGALLNTSFNIHGEPIVYSPQDAIDVFERSGLEMMYMEGYMLEKR